jgi:serine/threonine protein kinase
MQLAMTDTEHLPNCLTCGIAIPKGWQSGCPRCLANRLLGEPTEFLGAESPNISQSPASGFEKPHDKLPTPEELTALLPTGTYQVGDFLNQGGMGTIYKATQIRLKRPVAIKIMRRDIGKDYDFETRFEREAQSMAKLNHPNIVSVIDFGEAGPDYLYIVMELIDGVDLMELIRSGQMTQEVALSLLPQVCDALQFAHEHGIIHRDIKPSNIMLTLDGRVKIADFGLAKRYDAESSFLTQPGTGMGTPDYAAPEQFDPNSPIDHRADIYALGVMIYQMVTGLLPRGSWKPPSERSPVSSQWDKIISRAMQSDPADRYQQALDVKTDVSSISLLECNLALNSHGATTTQDEKNAPESSITIVGGSVLSFKRPIVGLILSVLSLALVSFGFFMAFIKKQPPLGAETVVVRLENKLKWQNFDFSKPPHPKELERETFENGMLRLKNYRSWKLPNFKARNAAIQATIRWEQGKTDFKLRLRCMPSVLNWPTSIWGLFLDQTSVVGYTQEDVGEPMLKDFPAEEVFEDGSEVVVGLATVGSKAFLTLNGSLAGVVDNAPIDVTGGAQIDAKQVLVKKIEVTSLDGLTESEALHLLGIK